MNPWGTSYEIVMGMQSPKNPTPPMDLNEATRIVRALFSIPARVSKEAIHINQTRTPLFTKEELVEVTSNLKSGNTSHQPN